MKKNRSVIKAFLPTFGNLFWLIALFMVMMRGRLMINIDGDLGRHITIGTFILDKGRIPLVDVFSHTMLGQPLTPHEWLSQIIFALSYRLFLFKGVVFLSALIIATSIWLIYKGIRLQHGALITSIFIVYISMFTSAIHWITRPHIFTILFLALWMLLLYQLRQGNYKVWWILPVLMVLWANLHGAFIAGLVTWFIYGFGIGWDAFFTRFSNKNPLQKKFWKYYLLSGGVSFLVTLINPVGFGLWKTSIGYIGNRFMVDHTYEYLSPDFHILSFWPFLIFIGLLFVGLGWSKKKHESGLIFSAAAWLAMALYSARNIPLFVIIAAPLLASCLDDVLIQISPRIKILKKFLDLDRRIQIMDRKLIGLFWPILGVLVFITALITGVRFNYNNQTYAYNPDRFPVDAVNWLDENPQEGEMFNYFIWGGYILFREWPEMQVFIDGQTDFYGEKLFRQYLQVINVEAGWENVLEEHEVSWAILPSNSRAAQAIHSELGWEIIYQDATATILRK